MSFLCADFLLFVFVPVIQTTRLAAERAQRQRQASKGVYRRKEYCDSLDEVVRQESIALRKKNKLPSKAEAARTPFPEHLA